MQRTLGKGCQPAYLAGLRQSRRPHAWWPAQV